jgi:hypothetical protein
VRPLVITLVAAAIAVSGCDDAESPDPAPPAGPLAITLAEIGAGGTDGSLGISWVEPGLLPRTGRERLITTVLAPNADTVVEGARFLNRRYGFDPLEADRLVSVGGSYAFGLRLDGVDGRGLAEVLVAAGGRATAADGLDLIEIGEYAVVPEPLLDADVNGLGAFDALGEDLSVLAISDRARSALLGEGPPMIDQAAYAAGARCLGEDAVAARMIPDKQLLGTELGIDLIALGVTPAGDRLCVVGGTSERANEVEAALRAGLAADAADPVTGEPIGATVAAATISRETAGPTEIVSAELELAPGVRPAAFFETISTGSLVSLINGEAESRLP